MTRDDTDELGGLLVGGSLGGIQRTKTPAECHVGLGAFTWERVVNWRLKWNVRTERLRQAVT